LTPIKQEEARIKAWISPHELKKIEGVWFKNGRVVVTTKKHEELREVIKQYHDVITAGHPGIAKTQELLARHYWWPSMKTDVVNYIQGCAECQRHKVNT